MWIDSLSLCDHAKNGVAQKGGMAWRRTGEPTGETRTPWDEGEAATPPLP